MAWRSSGSNNESMVDNLKRYAVIQTTPVEMALRKVDRRFFVPRNQAHLAHSDQPLREGHVHISAPHIYGVALEALEFQAGSSQSFLNLGSGSAYLSCVVANLLGPRSVHVSVEVSLETIAHARESLQQWQKANPHLHIPPLEIFHGNALHIALDKGEALTGFDRIYLGAAIASDKLTLFAQLLRPGGILVGPVDEDLVKVVRIGEGQTSSDTPAIPRTLRGQPPMLSREFSVQVLSGVRFASLVEMPAVPIVLPSRIWEPAKHSRYPDSFRMACKEILLCARSDRLQPSPPIPSSRYENNAAILPRALWMEVLSYTTRDWFAKPHNAEDSLRRRLQETQDALREAKEARQRVEYRMARMERERDLYKTLFLRLRSNSRTSNASLAVSEESLPRLLLHRQGDLLRLLGQVVVQENDEDDDDDDDVEQEEDDDQQDVDLDESDSDIDAMEEFSDTNEMEEDTPAAAASVSLGRQQPRTVSMSSDDVG